jgi:lipopolysaccharide transport system permease protein
LLWSFFNPVLMLAVYTFVFSVVFRARWGEGSESRMEFALILFSGLIVFNVFSDCVTRSPDLIRSHANYVRKVVFPLEVLPWVLLCSALFHAALSLLAWFAFSAFVFGWPPVSVVLFPLVLVPTVLLTAGVSFVLASLGVYLRDIGQMVGIATAALLFLSPIFYPLGDLPDSYRIWFYLNPLTVAVEAGRDVLIWGRTPDWALMGAYLVLTALAAWGGFSWFQKTRPGFADVV